MNSSNETNGHHDDALPPKLQIPLRAVSVVEHPCIVKNIDKGVVSLGGQLKLSKALKSKPEEDPELENDIGQASNLTLSNNISVSLRPDDPYAKRLVSNAVNTNNVLLKVTVPRRTGRKRKRGSSGPFLSEQEIQSACGDTTTTSRTSPSNLLTKAAEVFRSVQDNSFKYSVQAVGILDEAHRFRKLPDIQYAASRDSTMNDIIKNIVPLRYGTLKNYKPNTDAGSNLSNIVPPSAEFLQLPVSYNYKFQQNSFVKYRETGEEFNISKRLSSSGYHFIKSQDSIPAGPKPHLPPEASLSPHAKAVLAAIRAELKRRPIITRHLLYNTLGWHKRALIREYATYCGYFFESGPFREALIAWGHDPRRDPTYRRYQTVSYKSYKRLHRGRTIKMWTQHVQNLSRGMLPAEHVRKSHVFDGVHANVTGNIFQMCDISDPLIRKILDTEDIRTTCAMTSNGWYHMGTWAKATVILKDKSNRIVAGETPDNSLYDRVMTWPEQWNDQEMHETYRMEAFNKQLHKEKKQEHALMNYVRLAARSPLYAFEKLERAEEIARGQENGQSAQDDEALENEEEVIEDMEEIPDDAEAVMYEDGEGEEVDDQDEDPMDAASADEYDEGVAEQEFSEEGDDMDESWQ